MPTNVTKDSLADVENLLYHGYLEEDFFISDHCLTLRTLSSAEERELWLRYKNIRQEDQVHFVLDLLAAALHRVNGRRISDMDASWEFLWGLPRSLLGALYRFFRVRSTQRVSAAQSAVQEYSESTGSRSLWAAFKVTGTLPTPDFDFRASNIVQHLWFVVNHYRDETDDLKSEWDRAQFVADQICMFLDPKAFRQMSARRETKGTARIEHKAEENILAGIIEMMLPDDRKAFVKGVVDTDPDDMTMFLDKIPRQHLESGKEYKARVCEALERVCDAMDAEDDLHTQIMAEKADQMTLGFFRERRATLAIRNLRILLELMGPEKLEVATRQHIVDEVDVAVAERGPGYLLRSSDDIAHYASIMKCEGSYKHVAFVPPDRRVELLDQAISEPLAYLAAALDKNVDPYLLRKANSDTDIGPRGPDEPPPDIQPGDDAPPLPPTGPAGEVLGESPLGTDPATRPAPPEPPKRPESPARSDLADLVHNMAEEYRQRHPGVDEVADKIETADHVVESLGDWENTAQRKVVEEPLPVTDEEVVAADKARAADAKELEETDEGSARRETALGRRNEAVEALRRAKLKAGLTPELEREAFMDEIRRIARGDPTDPPEPPSSR